jgi:REP element-mobilizing transposase RayT
MKRAPTGGLVGFDPDRHHRRSIRLRNYDYAQAGAYFVTVCTHNRECLFGEVVDGKMQLNAAGQMVEQCWLAIPEHFPHVELDAFVVMPNHIHGIVVITNPVEAQFIAPNTQGAMNQGAMNRAPTLGGMVRAFKARSTRDIRLREPGVSVWQRNYYEHIIRSEESLMRIREYITNNPLQWALDRENPANIKQGEA